MTSPDLLEQCAREALRVINADEHYVDPVKIAQAVLAIAIPAVTAAPAGTVKIPTCEDEAAMMCLLGSKWLEDNAPHRLRETYKQEHERTRAAERERCAKVADGFTNNPCLHVAGTYKGGFRYAASTIAAAIRATSPETQK
jgi:hypothetical protein